MDEDPRRVETLALARSIVGRDLAKLSVEDVLDHAHQADHCLRIILALAEGRLPSDLERQGGDLRAEGRTYDTFTVRDSVFAVRAIVLPDESALRVVFDWRKEMVNRPVARIAWFLDRPLILRPPGFRNSHMVVWPSGCEVLGQYVEGDGFNL